MGENRYRPSSPQRRYADPRASTGMVFSTSFDGTNARYASQPRSGVDSFPVARHGSVYTTQPVRKTFLDDSHPGGSITRTEYSVRPRNGSNVSEQRRPMSTYVPRPSSPPPRNRPTVVSTARDDPRPPHVVPFREERYLVPASAQPRHHQRHASATRADQERLVTARAPRQPEYHRSGGYNAHPSYPSNHGPMKDEDFSYTTPKEQFLQESSRVPQRRESYSRRERPVSTIGIVPEYRVPQGRRDLGPPPSSARILERIDRPDPYRPSATRGTDSDTDRERGNDLPVRRHSTRAPVLHQYREDRNGGRSSPKDDRDTRPAPRPRHERYDDEDRGLKHRPRDDREREREPPPARDNDRPRERDRERDRDRDRELDRERERARDLEKNGKVPDERRKPRSRDPSPEHSGVRKGVAAAAGLAAAGGIASLASKASHNPRDESDSDDRKERKHRRRRAHRDDPEPEELAGRLERDLVINGDRPSHDHRRSESKPDETAENEEERRERRKHHRKHRDKQARGDETDTTEDSIEKNSRHRAHEREREGELREPTRPRREREASREDDRAPPEPQQQQQQQRTMSPGEDEDSRPRRVQLVEPVERREEFRPKGILKKPRAVPFPEDPNPQREGVAPLKDAGKEGIPPNARWTKISRALVNPEALEKSHERFEERDDYVIVLRVVTREEIMKFAEKTKEIRGICLSQLYFSRC